MKDYGVTSFKYFMNFKGEEGRYLGLDGTDDGYFYDLLQRVGARRQADRSSATPRTSRSSTACAARCRRAGGNTLKDWAACKPAITESEPAIRAMYFAEQHGARVYFPHISSRLALDEVRNWRKRYDEVWIETCPHYLTHTEDSDLGGIGKANPPFRTQGRPRGALGSARSTAPSTSSPPTTPRAGASPRTSRSGSPRRAFPASRRSCRCCSRRATTSASCRCSASASCSPAAPAKIFDLAPVEGPLAPGCDADFTIVDLDKERKFVRRRDRLYADYSLYEGQMLKGWPVRTIVRGVTVMEDHKLVGEAGHGKYLRRTLDRRAS